MRTKKQVNTSYYLCRLVLRARYWAIMTLWTLADLVLWGVISVTYSRLSGQSHCLLLIELFQEVLQVRPGKLPLKWFGGLLIEPLESQEALADFLEGSKIIGSKHLPLDN